MKEIKKKSDKITKELEIVQSFNKDVTIPVLREISYIQETMQRNLGLCVIPEDFYAPTRYYLGDINFHPRFGVKRFKGNRCDENLPLLLELINKTEEILADITKKISELKIPVLDLSKYKLLSKLL